MTPFFVDASSRNKVPRAAIRLAGLSALMLALLGSLAPMATAQEPSPTPTAGSSESVAEVSLVPIPMPDMEALDDSVREVIERRHQALLSRLSSGAQDPAVVMESYGELGFLFHAHELWESALACYHNALRLAPEDPRWIYATALALKSSGDLDGAAQAYELTVEQLPQNATALVGLAEVRLEQNMPLVARAHLWHVLELTAESPAALALLGQVALSNQNHARAVDYLTRALDQVPGANRLHYPLALAYRGLGEMEKAKEHLAQRGSVGIRAPDPISDAIEERKTGERVMILEGRRAFGAERFEEAIESFKKALVANPESIAARVNLATAIAATGDREGAKAEYRKVLEQDPANSASSFNLGTLLLQENKVAEAVGLLEKAVAADARDAESRGLLAKAYESQGKLSEALGLIQEAAALNRASPEYVLVGYRLMARLGLHGDAKEWLSSAHRSMPEQGAIAFELAELLATSPQIELRDGKLAVTLASQVAQATGSPNHWLTLAKALAENGQCADAAAIARQLMDQTDEGSKKTLEQLIQHFESGPPCRL